LIKFPIRNPAMKELKDIIRAYDEAVQKVSKTALATVVHLEGLAHRRPEPACS